MYLCPQGLLVGGVYYSLLFQVRNILLKYALLSNYTITHLPDENFNET